VKRVSSILLICVALSVRGALWAQTPSITAVDAILLEKQKFLDVFFNKPLDAAHPEDLQNSNFEVSALPSKTSLNVSGVRRLGGDPTEIEIALTGDAQPSDVQILVTAKKVHFLDNQNSAFAGPLTFTATLIKDSKSLTDAMTKLVDTMTKAGKSSQEKNIFASGFVTTASNGNTQGGADIHLQTDLSVPGLRSFLNLVKTTADGSDAKNFEAGGTFRNTFLLGKVGRAAIQTALNDYRNATTDAARAAAAVTYNKSVTDFQKRVLAAVFLDFTGKMEGEATNFNITNGVFEAALKLQSRVKNLSKQGFFHFQISPFGLEGGRTLRKPDVATAATGTTTMAPTSPTDKALQQIDGIARFKVGATLNTFWDNPKTTSPLKRFEIEAGVVERYLFRKEIYYNAATKTNASIVDGSKPYFYADAKLFMVESSAGRYGVKISYNRGSLPPVYANVKSFQFGFLFESAN